MTRLLQAFLPLLAVISAVAAADDLRGARQLLCSTLQSQLCLSDGECTPVPPAEINVPQFIRLDAKSGTLATTAASGLNRVTTAKSISRSEGQLILQGVELGRAFSLFIDEASGNATFASALDGMSVTVFAACTPAAAN